MGGITLSAAIWPVLEVQPAGLDHQIRMPNPLRLLPHGPLDDGPGDFEAAAGVLIFALLIASIVSMLVRYVRSTGVERLQLRWLVTGLASVAVAVPVGFLLFALFGEAIEGLAWLPAMVAFTVPPIAIGIAVLRYRLYEIDRLISRTIGWAVVTGILLAVFGGAVLGLQAVLSDVTQGETLAVAASTLVAYALFQPLRRRVQSAVNHRFDRARVDADRTATAFAARLRDQIDLGGLEADIAGTVETALRPTSTGIWIRGASR
jgi:drug/metabolite transporter (DMT)-like permease